MSRKFTVALLAIALAVPAWAKDKKPVSKYTPDKYAQKPIAELKAVSIFTLSRKTKQGKPAEFTTNVSVGFANAIRERAKNASSKYIKEANERAEERKKNTTFNVYPVAELDKILADIDTRINSVAARNYFGKGENQKQREAYEERYINKPRREFKEKVTADIDKKFKQVILALSGQSEGETSAFEEYVAKIVEERVNDARAEDAKKIKRLEQELQFVQQALRSAGLGGQEKSPKGK